MFIFKKLLFFIEAADFDIMILNVRRIWGVRRDDREDSKDVIIKKSNFSSL